LNLLWGKLKEVLTKEGEKIEPSDLDTYLTALIGDSLGNQENLLDDSSFMNSKIFASRILGFEEDYQ
jgi:hypothetical protein